MRKRRRIPAAKVAGLVMASVGSGMLLIIIIPSWSFILAVLLLAIGIVAYILL